MRDLLIITRKRSFFLSSDEPSTALWAGDGCDSTTGDNCDERKWASFLNGLVRSNTGRKAEWIFYGYPFVETLQPWRQIFWREGRCIWNGVLTRERRSCAEVSSRLEGRLPLDWCKEITDAWQTKPIRRRFKINPSPKAIQVTRERYKRPVPLTWSRRKRSQRVLLVTGGLCATRARGTRAPAAWPCRRLSLQDSSNTARSQAKIALPPKLQLSGFPKR